MSTTISTTAIATVGPPARRALFFVIAAIASVALIGMLLAVSELALETQTPIRIGDKDTRASARSR